jgi:4-amino-4-deoxy-L-arabinose transferase-like glycosyltransferase
MTTADDAAALFAQPIQTTPPAVKAMPGIVTRLGYVGGLVAMLVLYALLIRAHWQPAILHPDANGYWAQASLLVETGRSWFKPESNAQYVGIHWLLTPDGKYVSRYPVGFPAVVGLVYAVFGWQASVLVNPALALLTLVGVYAVAARLLASPAWGLFAAVAVAINGAFTAHALTDIAHMPVAFCLVWGVYLLLRWSDTGRWGWAFAGGIVLGCIPGARYADSIIALGVLAFLLMHVRTFPNIWKHYLAAVGGAAIPIVPLLVRNQLVFGAFWKTGYALTNEQTGFSREWFAEHAAAYLQLLQGNGMGILFGLGVIGFAWMLATPRVRAAGTLLVGMVVPFVVVYMAYYWARGVMGGGRGGNDVGGAMRFLVPVVPLIAIAGTWTLARAMTIAPTAAKVAVPVVVIAMQLLTYGSNGLAELRQMRDRKTPLAMATRDLQQVAAAGDVVMADNGFLQHLDFVRRWKLADPSVATGRGMGGGRSNRDPDGPSPMQQEKNEARSKLYSGTTVQRQKQFLTDVRAWAGPDHAIFAVGREADLSRLLPGVPREEVTVVSKFTVPGQIEREPDMGRGGFGGGGGPGAFAGGPDAGNRGWRPGAPRRGGGLFGPGVRPGDEVVIVKWAPKD